MRALVTGAAGFIGGHLVDRLLAEGNQVFAVDSKPPERWHQAHPGRDLNRLVGDVATWCDLPAVDEVYHLAANMGGVGYMTTNRLPCASSTLIDLNIIEYARRTRPRRLFYPSSACVYPRSLTTNLDVELRETMAWPAEPEEGYGLQKLYSEELMRYLREDEGIETRVARYHTVYGPQGTWGGGREKAPSALCRKVAQAVIDGDDHIEVWGDGQQTRTYMYVDDCVEGTLRLTRSGHPGPLNIGSDQLVTTDELARVIMGIAGVDLAIRHVRGAQGVRGRGCDLTATRSALGWEPTTSLIAGFTATYRWIFDQVKAAQ